MKKFLMLFLIPALLLSCSACSAEDVVMAFAGDGLIGDLLYEIPWQDSSEEDFFESPEEDDWFESSEENAWEAEPDYMGEYEDSDFEPELIFSSENCRVTLLDIDLHGSFGDCFLIECENLSGEQSLSFSVQDSAINGLACLVYDSLELEPGAIGQFEVRLDGEELQEYGVEEYTDIMLHLEVTDAEDWSIEEADEFYHYYPLGEEAAEPFVWEPGPDDICLMDCDEAALWAIDFDADEFWGFRMHLFLQNKSGSEAMFTLEDVTVNNREAGPSYVHSVPAGIADFDFAYWDEDMLNEADVSMDEIEELAFNVRVYDNDNWDAEDWFNQHRIVYP